jgi:hypothetical protein
MPTNKPRTIVTFPSAEIKESLERKAAKLGISLNNYILRRCGVKELKWGGKRERINTDKPNERKANTKDR